MAGNGRFSEAVALRLRAWSSPPPRGTLQIGRLANTIALSRDARFDGLFFTAAHGTGIFCRPVCPAPAPMPENRTDCAIAAAAANLILRRRAVAPP